MKNLSALKFLLTVSLFISSISLFGQLLEPKKRLSEPDTTISSKIMGRDFQLYISFPTGYSVKDTTKYPVLYILDGMHCYPVFKSVRESMDIDKELEDVIIVGIGSGLDYVSWQFNRSHEYTPSQDTAKDRQFEKVIAEISNLDYNLVKGTLKSGGGELFLKCLTTEIIPFIDTHYKTTKDRGIYGHSLGGLFCAWCLLNTKGVFNKYSINSPSLWWNKREVLKQAELFINKNETWDIPPTKIFISVGDKEETKYEEKFSELLEAKAYKNVSVTLQQFPGENHNSARAVSLKRTLSVLYGKKK